MLLLAPENKNICYAQIAINEGSQGDVCNIVEGEKVLPKHRGNRYLLSLKVLKV